MLRLVEKLIRKLCLAKRKRKRIGKEGGGGGPGEERDSDSHQMCLEESNVEEPV